MFFWHFFFHRKSFFKTIERKSTDSSIDFLKLLIERISKCYNRKRKYYLIDKSNVLQSLFKIFKFYAKDLYELHKTNISLFGNFDVVS